MAFRRLLNKDDDFWDDNDDFHDRVERAATISVGIIIAIVVGIILFVIVSVIVCIYCVCRRRQFSSGTVVQRGAPAPQVTTYSFPSAVPPQHPVPHQHPVPPHGYGPGSYPPPAPPTGYPPPPAPTGAYPQPYPPAGGGGWTQPGGVVSPPPYIPQAPPPMGFNEKQMASAPPMD